MEDRGTGSTQIVNCEWWNREVNTFQSLIERIRCKRLVEASAAWQNEIRVARKHLQLPEYLCGLPRQVNDVGFFILDAFSRKGPLSLFEIHLLPACMEQFRFP